MQKKKFRVICLSILFVVSVCVGNNKNKQKVEFTDPLRPIMVTRAKPVFTITLKSNPTTGYSWLLRSYDANLITPISRKFFPPSNEKTFLAGAAGHEKWTFRVKPAGFVVPQTTGITLVYVRPWDDQSAQATNFRVVTGNVN